PTNWDPCIQAFGSGTSWSTKPGLGDRPADFYPEAGLVAPTASMAQAFTGGMGIDPGASFFTNQNGDGQVHVTLDYNLLGGLNQDGTINYGDDGPPVGNKTTVQQCVQPGPPLTYPLNCPSSVPIPGTLPSLPTKPTYTVTSTWLRKFIYQVPDP